MTRNALPIVCLAIALGSAGCEDGHANCVALCDRAQAGDCTAISGDCGDFCSALESIEEPSGCVSEWEDYQSCLNRGAHVCDVDCDGAESALESCVGSYCLLHPSEPDCRVLVASFG